ncbi:hypothetical protein AXG94_15895 [Pseudomonas corrugata]|nr:hypothetical protein AXG94_15895 [Pseudomonas corrugata]
MQIFFLANGPVVETFLPKRSLTLHLSIEGYGGPGLRARNQFRKPYILQFNQPMKMVRHDNPGQGTGELFLLSFSKGVHYQTSCLEAIENRIATERYYRQ